MRIWQLPALRSPLLEPAMAPIPGTGSTFLHFAAGDSGDKETVTVQRRRRPTSTGERERATTPTRDREPDKSSPPPPPPQGPSGPSGGSRPPSPGGGLPGGGRMRLSSLVLVLAIILCIGAFSLFNRGGNQGDVGVVQPPAAEVATARPAPTEAVVTPEDTAGTTAETAAPTPASAAAAVNTTGVRDGQNWLIMLYQDADDKILEQDIFVDFNEAERAGSSDRVQIVSQLDRFNGGYRGGGDWTGTKRFFVTQDDDLESVGSQQVVDLGEANMADGDTLVDFVTWAVGNYPADKYVLIMADHGMGWPGGWSDPTASGRSGGNSPLEQRLGDQLYLYELDAALEEIRAQTGIDKFELIGMDACLMGHLEVFSMLEKHARFAVASQETEPALGWAYTSFLQELQKNPDVTGAELGTYIVNSYIDDDQRVVDEQARLDFVGGGRGIFGGFALPSADQLARQLEANVTLAAVDLSTFPALMESVDELAYQLQRVDQRGVAQARSYAQSYTSIFGDQVPPSYIDLGNFAGLLQESTRDSEIVQAARRVQDALGVSVIAERHGLSKPGSRGVSVYFPNSQLYRNAVSGYQSYGVVADAFAQASLWDDFLAYHYTGREFEPAAREVSMPQDAGAVRGPAAGNITVSPIRASATSVAPGETVLLSVDISGENVGYVKLLAGFYDAAANSIYLADQDYLESRDTRQIDGVYYPEWPEDEFTMEFAWEPIVFAIDDGGTTAETVFAPQTYGATYEEAQYTVEGVYTYADEGVTRPARLYFRNGVLEQVFGFTGEEGTGAPREILPNAGDTFTVLEQWLDLGPDGRVVNVTTEEGKTLTFGDEPFTWVDLDAAAGEYVVGFLVEDLDGNQYPVYTQIRVE